MPTSLEHSPAASPPPDSERHTARAYRLRRLATLRLGVLVCLIVLLPYLAGRPDAIRLNPGGTLERMSRYESA